MLIKQIEKKSGTVLNLIITLFLIGFAGCNDSTIVEVPVRIDGEGTVSVSGEPVTTNRYCTLYFDFITGPSGIAQKGSILFIVSPFWGWSKPQIENPGLSGFVTVDHKIKRDLKLKIEQGDLSYIIVSIDRGELFQGDKIRIVYGAKPKQGGAALADRFAESAQEFIFETDADADGTYGKIEKQPVVAVLPGPPAQLIATCPSECVINEPCRLNIAVLDQAFNRVVNWNGRVKIISAGLFKPDEMELKISGEIDKPITLIPVKSGIARFHVEAFGDSRDEYFKTISNPVIVIEEEKAEQIFWGDIHGHSVLSDGTGTPDDFYSYARDVSGMDFAALTDHDSWGFRPLEQNIEYYSKVCNFYNEPDRFVTFLAYEWTQWEDGHRNVYTKKDTITVYNHENPNFDEPAELCDAYSSDDSMVIPHHLGGGPITHNIDFNDPDIMFLAEVASIHGVSEVYGANRMIYKATKGKFYRDALMKGYLWGAIAASDSHDGHPGLRTRGLENRGVVAVFAAKLNRNTIFCALKNRRCYGTTGARIYINFSINGIKMGEISNLDPSVARSVKAYVLGEDDLERVVLVKNGVEIKRFYGYENVTRILWSDPEPPTEMDWYYLKVQQMNGEQAFTSPIWIKPSDSN